MWLHPFFLPLRTPTSPLKASRNFGDAKEHGTGILGVCERRFGDRDSEERG